MLHITQKGMVIDMAELIDYLEKAVKDNASDLFIVAGSRVCEKVEKCMQPISEGAVYPQETEQLITELYARAKRPMAEYRDKGDDDFSFSVPGLARFRVNTYRQRGSMAAVVRVVVFEIPNWQSLHIPSHVLDLADVSHGMVLVTGTAGSGKSTTQACIIDRINRTRGCHIVTLEDPIEFLHRNQKSIVSQREINVDTESYVTALRAALRQSPDVILLGEMRDYETINVAMTAAETGHLLLSTLHTIGAANTINRIIDVFPANQQRQICIQLSTVLNAVVSQQLVPTTDGGMVPAFEILTVTPAIRNMIRENKVPQIEAQVYSAAKEDTISMDNSLLALYKQGRISRDTALKYATNPDMLGKKL